MLNNKYYLNNKIFAEWLQSSEEAFMPTLSCNQLSYYHDDGGYVNLTFEGNFKTKDIFNLFKLMEQKNIQKGQTAEDKNQIKWEDMMQRSE